MSPKTQAFLTMIVGILSGLTYVSTDLAGAGFPTAAKVVLMIATLASLVKANALPALFGKHAPKPAPEAPKETPAS
jgi:hypothetical protein